MKKKYLLLIPIVLIVFSTLIIYNNYQQTGDWINKDIDLKDRNMIIVKLSQQTDLKLIENLLTKKYGSVLVSEMKTLNKYGVIIETDVSFEPDDVVNTLEAYQILVDSYSFEIISPVVEETFFIRLGSGLLIGFVLVGIVMFVIHGNPIISFYTILIPIADIIVVFGVFSLIGIKMNLIVLTSLLILIPYSIEMSLLLIKPKMKKESFKLTFTWPLTIISGLAITSFVFPSKFLTNVIFVFAIGVVSDFIFKWVMNKSFEGSELNEMV